MSKLVIFTIVLDGYRFLPHHFFTLSRLTDIDWQWIIVEGAAANTGTTRWCKPQQERLSSDGSHEFLCLLQSHPRIRFIGDPWWSGGKDAMCQAALDTIKEPCILMQMDADELYESIHYVRLLQMFEAMPHHNCARFDCVYMVGHNLRIIGRDCWGMQKGEFLRAWRFTPGMKMRHEPPFLEGVNGPKERCIPNETTRERGIVFMHWAYAFLDQLEYKRDFYGYPTAVEGWKRLQAYKGPFPTALKPFFPWVNGDPMVDLLHRA